MRRDQTDSALGTKNAKNGWERKDKMEMKIELRAFEDRDLERLFQMTSNPRMAKYMRFDTHTSREEAAALLEEYRAGLAWAVELEGEMIGMFQFKTTEEERVFSMSVMIDEPYWNQGIAGRLLEERTAYAREVLGARALTAYVVSLNYGSRRTLQKNGYREDKRLTFPDLEGELILYRKDLI